jgi:hypothetical protein
LNIVGAVLNTISSAASSPRGCPDPTDLWADLWDLLPPEAPARELVRLALHVNSFDADLVHVHCMPWLLDPFAFLQGCSRSQRDAVCSGIAAFVFLVGAFVADDEVHAGALLDWCVALCLLLRCRLRPVFLGVAPSGSAPLGMLRPRPRWGRAWSPIDLFFIEVVVVYKCVTSNKKHQIRGKTIGDHTQAVDSRLLG